MEYIKYLGLQYIKKHLIQIMNPNKIIFAYVVKQLEIVVMKLSVRLIAI